MFKSLDEVKQAVEENDGVITVEMRELRDAFGAAKIGTHVLSGIATRLTELGLRTIPAQLPNSQSELVRLIEMEGPISELLTAMVLPGAEYDKLIQKVMNPIDCVRMADSSEAKALRHIRNIIDWHFADERDMDGDVGEL